MHRVRDLAKLLSLTNLLLLLCLAVFPASAAAQAASGILSVSAPVQGAIVYVDGGEVGKTPLTTYVVPGSHQIRVVVDNYDPYVRRVDIAPDLTTRVDAMLVAGHGTVEFMVRPTEAQVEIDGEIVGASPIRIRDVAPGRHTYRVWATGFESRDAGFVFETGKNLLFDFELQSSKGLFDIQTEPHGATIYFDGWEAGQSPLQLKDIPAGVHHVRVSLDGYAELFRTVDTSDGLKGEVVATLSRRAPRLVVKTGHGDATVALASNDLGSGRKVKVKLIEQGEYSVLVEAPGYQSATFVVLLPFKGVVRLKARLAPADSEHVSRIVQLKPFYARWGFWALAGGTTAAGVAGGVALVRSFEPDPLPTGDVVVEIP